MSRGAELLRELFARPGIVKCAGAHNASGARVAEIAGFDAIWSSSFEISASNCVPDSSVLSMTEYLQVADSITRAVSLPVVADCDTGYGNETNVTYAVKRFEASGIAGVSIEDQVFPKANSLLDGPQKLVSITEFQDKIHAAKKAQVRPEFMIIARVQALVAGAGQEEAQVRAREYAAAGADAILIHWNESSIEPIRRFLEMWTTEVPIVVIPTTYYCTSVQQLEALGAKMVIYANHGLRSALDAMERTFRAILATGSSSGVEPAIWPVDRVFEDLQGIKNRRRPSTTDSFQLLSNDLATREKNCRRRLIS
jgi:phosphoenolpyruvate phosphomutase